MSLSEPARSDSPSEAQSESLAGDPSGNLPAPYVSPWLEFGRNLKAMAADLRLRGQELWRRNREGELSVPGFWPRDLAPSFWPLLLVLLLLLSGIASAAAQTEGVCGNTYVDNSGGGLMCNGIPCDEGCDDGNLDDGDGCSQFCTVEDGWSCTGEAAIAACRRVCFSMLPISIQHSRFRGPCS